MRPLYLLALALAACSVDPLDATAKHCSSGQTCPAPLVCMPVGDEDARCLQSVEVTLGAADDEGSDATLTQNAPSSSVGSESVLRVDGDHPTGTLQRRVALLRFALPSMPGSRVLAARLQLHVLEHSHGSPYEIATLTRAWTEGAASWTQAAAGQPWEQPGATGPGDRGATVAYLSPEATGTLQIALSGAGIAAVQEWLDEPSANHGLIVSGERLDGLSLASGEAADPAQRPRLVLGVLPPSVD